MTEGLNYSDWVDRYVRNELGEEEEFEFEVALLGSEELKKELEAALSIKFLLRDQAKIADAVSVVHKAAKRAHWQNFALAASVVLAVISTTMYLRVSVENHQLSESVAELNEPRTGVLIVPVNIMRSAASQTPDVRILKPEGHSSIILDIELAPVSLHADSLSFNLVQDQSLAEFSWTAFPTSNDRVRVAINTEAIKEGLYWLEISNSRGEILERRLLEFKDRL